MKKLLVVLCICSGFISLPAQNSFIRTYEQSGGNNFNTSVSAIAQCSNGNILLAWRDYQIGYAVISRIDASGVPIWNYSLGDLDPTSQHTIHSIGENPNGTTWVFGSYYDAVYSLKYFLSELDAAGQENWTRFYYATDEQMYNLPSCRKMADGGFMINLSVSTHLQALRTDSDGNLLWGKTFKTDSNDYKHPGFFGTPTYDGGFVMTGKEGADMSIVKIDMNGNPVWGYGFNPVTQTYSHLKTICELTDGSLIAGGYTGSSSVLLRIDITGNIDWIKSYGTLPVGYSSFYNLLPALDGSFYVTGNNDIFMHIDVNGNVLSSVSYESVFGIPAYSIAILTPGEELLVGVSPIDANNDIRLLKLPTNLGPNCSTIPITTVTGSLAAPPLASIQRTVTVGFDGIETTGVLMYAPIGVDWAVECIATEIAETQQSTTLQLFPNPATSGAAIRYTTSVAGRWTVTDATGRTVLEGRATAGTQQLPTETLSSGLYIFRLTDEAGQVQQEKLLID